MVGSPVEGENIEKIMLKILDSKLKKRKNADLYKTNLSVTCHK